MGDNRDHVLIDTSKFNLSDRKCSVVINTIFKLLVLRDRVTSDHSLIMAYYNMMIAKEFDKGNSTMYYLAGLVHDVGKIAMDDAILKGNTKLTREKFEEVKDHVPFGANLLMELELPTLVVNISKYHHERYDGSGYCEQLKGQNIPLCGRIAAIADTYATLIGGRRYEQPRSPEEALDIMDRESYLFDPTILAWFSREVLDNNVKDFAPALIASRFNLDYLARIS